MVLKSRQAVIQLVLTLTLWGEAEVFCRAGESAPLRITGSSGASLLPNTNSTQMQVEKLLKSLGPDKSPSMPSDSPWIMPPPPSSSTPFRNPKLQELIDQRKNWIYRTPEMQNQSYQESTDPLSSKLNKSAPKSTVERYWDLERSKLPANQRELDGFSSSSSLLSRTPSSSSGFETLPSLQSPFSSSSGSLSNSLNSLPGSRLSSDGALNTPGSFTLAPLPRTAVPGMTKDLFGERTKVDEFERILRPTSMAAPKPVVSNNDPINSALDATRQNIQPIVPGGPLEDLAAAPGLSLSPDHPRSPAFLGSLDIPAARPGGSSLNPSFANGASSWVQPKPAVLEFPKRRF